MEHVTIIEYEPQGHLGMCETCGARNTEFTGFGEAHRWCDEHAKKAREGRLNTDGPRNPSLKTVEKIYRENGHNMTYTAPERTVWLMMADEIADEIAAQNPGPLPGQMELWGDQEGEAHAT